MKLRTTKIIALSASIAIMALASCNKEYWTPIAKVDIKAEPTAIVANCYLQNNEAVMVAVGRNQPPLSTGNSFLVSSATIELYDNGTLVNGWQDINNTGMKIYSNANAVATPGHVYKMVVNSPGLPMCEATDTMPTQVPFTITKGTDVKVVTVTQGGGSTRTDSLIDVTIKFTDNGSTKDYYRILILDTTLGGYALGKYLPYQNMYSHIPIRSIDPIFAQSNLERNGPFGGADNTEVEPNAVYFSDFSFNGSTKEIKLQMPINYDPNLFWTGYTKAYFFLQHISRAAYLHVTTANETGQPAIFSQPLLVHSNFKNGYGILGCCTTSMDSVKFK